MAEYPIIPDKTALLFFDPLNIYLHPDEPLAAAKVEASGIIPRLMRLNEICRRAGISVFYARADHRTDHRDFAPLIAGPSPGAPPGRRGQTDTGAEAWSGMPNEEIIPEIAPQPADYVIRKHRWSAFFQTHLELSLRTAGINTDRPGWRLDGSGNCEHGVLRARSRPQSDHRPRRLHLGTGRRDRILHGASLSRLRTRDDDC